MLFACSVAAATPGCIPRQGAVGAPVSGEGEPVDSVATTPEQLLLPDAGGSRAFPNGMQNPALRQVLDNADMAPDLAREEGKEHGPEGNAGKKGKKAKRQAKKRRLEMERRALPSVETHESALRRQLLADWGWRNDKDDQVHVPLIDWRNWKRIRVWTLDHLTAFKYTDDNHLLTAAFTVETPGIVRPTSRQCMEAFESKALAELEQRRVRRTPVLEGEGSWRGEPILVHVADGSGRFFFKTYEFSTAWAAYPAYREGCLIYATVVLWDGEPDLARRVRDRWVREGFRAMNVRTTSIPFRH